MAWRYIAAIVFTMSGFGLAFFFGVIVIPAMALYTSMPLNITISVSVMFTAIASIASIWLGLIIIDREDR